MKGSTKLGLATVVTLYLWWVYLHSNSFLAVHIICGFFYLAFCLLDVLMGPKKYDTFKYNPFRWIIDWADKHL